MFRQLISLMLVWLLLGPGAHPALSGSRQNRVDTIRQKVLDIPFGSIVEVNTLDRQKLHGRIGAATDAGFPVQIARNDKLETLTIDFTNVKSIRVVAKKGDGSSAKATAGWILIGGLSALGVLFLVGLIIAASGHWD